MDKLPLLYWLARIGGLIGIALTTRYLWQDYKEHQPLDRLMQGTLILSSVLVALSFTNAI